MVMAKMKRPSSLWKQSTTKPDGRKDLKEFMKTLVAGGGIEPPTLGL
jgi:hypothetical protein